MVFPIAKMLIGGTIWDPLDPVTKVPPGLTDDETIRHCFILAEVCLSSFPLKKREEKNTGLFCDDSDDDDDDRLSPVVSRL